MDKLNTVHRYFKSFMRSHGGYGKEDIQGWCNLFYFIFNHNGNPQRIIRDFLQMGVKTRKLVRYRDVMRKKPQK